MEKLTITKEQFFNFLVENTQIEDRYIGGDSEPCISFKNSELEDYTDQSREQWISSLVENLFSKD